MASIISAVRIGAIKSSLIFLTLCTVAVNRIRCFIVLPIRVSLLPRLGARSNTHHYGSVDCTKRNSNWNTHKGFGPTWSLVGQPTLFIIEHWSLSYVNQCLCCESIVVSTGLSNGRVWSAKGFLPTGCILQWRTRTPSCEIDRLVVAEFDRHEYVSSYTVWNRFECMTVS